MLVQAQIETTEPYQDSIYMEKPICQCSVRKAYHGLHGAGRNRSGLYINDQNRCLQSNQLPAAFTDGLAAAGRTDAGWPVGETRSSGGHGLRHTDTLTTAFNTLYAEIKPTPPVSADILLNKIPATQTSPAVIPVNAEVS